MASEGTEATDAGEPEQQRWPAPVTSPAGECAGSSPAGEQLGVEGGESPSDSPVRAERSGGESLIGEIPRLVAEALLDADAHASPLDNASQAPFSLSSLPANPMRQRRPPPQKPTEQWPQPMQRAAPMYHYAHPSAGSMPVGMWGPQQMHMVAPPPGVGPRGMPAFVTLMPGPSRDGVARCEQTKDCAGWPMAPPNTIGQSAPPC